MTLFFSNFSVDELLRRIDTDTPEKIIKLRSHALYGQTVVFIVTHATVNRRLDSVNYSDEDIDLIAAIIAEHTDNILKSFIGEAI